MSSWNCSVYFSYRFHTFLIHPSTSYEELTNLIRTRLAITIDHYLLEIYDARFQTYVLLNDEYIQNLQNRLPKTSISTLKGRIRKRTKSIIHHRKRQRTTSLSLNNDNQIIWFDQSVGYSNNNNHNLKHRLDITTTVDITRSMLNYDLCINDLIQNNHLTIFNNQEECLNFIAQIESKIKILFIISNLSNQEILPLIAQRVQMIYILGNDTLFPFDWPLDNQLNLLIFDDNVCLLVRLMRDLARNVLDKAMSISNSSSVEQTIIFLKWARKLFHRAMEIDYSSESNIIRSIDQQLEILENDCHEKVALECNDF